MVADNALKLEKITWTSQCTHQKLFVPLFLCSFAYIDGLGCCKTLSLGVSDFVCRP